MVGWMENNAAFPVLMRKVSIWFVSFGAPGEMSVAQPGMTCKPASSSTVTLGPRVKLGRSLTALTVILTVAGPESNWPSVTLKRKLSGPK